MVKLTVIITFLNEGIEILNTVKSIRETAGERVSIILINDNSTDDIDYEDVARKHNCYYYFNHIRLGVAKSRDKGVSLITTPYFLILDGHMRFYQNDWVDILISNLEINHQTIFCCTCAAIDGSGKIVNPNYGYGANIDFDYTNFWQFIQPNWVSYNMDPEINVIDIPCVLGATESLSPPKKITN